MDNLNIPDYIIKGMAQKSLLNSFRIYGIEGTEDKIKEVYKNLPKIKQIMLEEYRNLLKRR